MNSKISQVYSEDIATSLTELGQMAWVVDLKCLVVLTAGGPVFTGGSYEKQTIESLKAENEVLRDIVGSVSYKAKVGTGWNYIVAIDNKDLEVEDLQSYSSKILNPSRYDVLGINYIIKIGEPGSTTSDTVLSDFLISTPMTIDYEKKFGNDLVEISKPSSSPFISVYLDDQSTKIVKEVYIVLYGISKTLTEYVDELSGPGGPIGGEE